MAELRLMWSLDGQELTMISVAAPPEILVTDEFLYRTTSQISPRLLSFDGEFLRVAPANADPLIYRVVERDEPMRRWTMAWPD